MRLFEITLRYRIDVGGIGGSGRGWTTVLFEDHVVEVVVDAGAVEADEGIILDVRAGSCEYGG